MELVVERKMKLGRVRADCFAGDSPGGVHVGLENCTDIDEVMEADVAHTEAADSDYLVASAAVSDSNPGEHIHCVVVVVVVGDSL